MITTNVTQYDTRDLRRMVLAGLAALHTTPPRRLRISYSDKFHDRHWGCAAYSGRSMTLSLPRDPARFDVATFARLLAHEAAHLRGLYHGQMNPHLRYGSTKLEIPWAAGWTTPRWRIAIASPPIAPEVFATSRLAASPAVRPRLASLVERRAAKAQAMLARAEADLAKVEKRVRKWRTKVRYYNRKIGDES